MKKIPNPLVSIIIRTKDRPNLLTRAIESVYSQTYPNIEIIVINDGGADVLAVINHFKNLPIKGNLIREIQYVSNEVSHQRPAAANIGFQVSTGDYLGLLDDDDYFFADHISTHISNLLKQESKISFSKATESIEDYDEVINQNRRFAHFPSTYSKLSLLFFDNYFPINSFIFHKSVLENIGMFDESKKVLEDWDFIIRLIINYEPIIINKVTAEYTTRIGWFNIRQDKNQKSLWKETFSEIRKKYKKQLSESNLSLPISEISDFLSEVAQERYTLVKENEELRDSFAFKLFYHPYYSKIKKLAKLLHLTKIIKR